MDGGAPTCDGDDGPVFPEPDYLSDEDVEKLTAAETFYNNKGYGIKWIIVMAMGLQNATGDGPLVDKTMSPWNVVCGCQEPWTVNGAGFSW